MGLIKSGIYAGAGMYAINRLARAAETRHQPNGNRYAGQQYYQNDPRGQPQQYPPNWYPPQQGQGQGQYQDNRSAQYQQDAYQSSSASNSNNNNNNTRDIPPTGSQGYRAALPEPQYPPPYAAQPQRGFVLPEGQSFDQSNGASRYPDAPGVQANDIGQLMAGLGGDKKRGRGTGGGLSKLLG